MSDFKTVLVRDSTIGDITADIDFAVKSGASQCTYQRFPSTSASNSSIIFNVQVPSENVVIGRDVLLTTGLTFTVRCGGAGVTVPLNTPLFTIGNNFSLQAFPLNSLFTTATVQINNTTCSINMKDVLPSLLRMNDSRELYRWNSSTPSLPDQAYGNYADAVGTSNNPLAAYGNASYDVDQVPRGAFPLRVAAIYVNGALVAGTDLRVGTNTAGDTYDVVLTTVVTEPLFLSPFIYGNPEYNQQGFLGINNMAFTLNIDSTAARLCSAIPAGVAGSYVSNIANPITLGNPYTGALAFSNPANVGLLGAVSAPALLFKFLSTQPSDLVQTKNIVPYMDFPRYLTASANNPAVPAGTATTLTTSNLQINQIPDLFIINIRKPMAQQNCFDTSSFFAIRSISINLNNQSGLLSSASTFDLWKMSVRNGSTQSWAEFSGQAQKTDATGAGALVPSTGSLLIINPAFDLSLPDYISCGSLGNYNFQATISCVNQFGVEIRPEIIVTCVNSGIFTTQQGVSAVYTGILTKEMVLSAKSGQQASAMHSAEVERMVGGQMLNRALSGMRRFGYARRHRAEGGVSSGGVSSGGVSSGGRLKKMY
jgi:hypothetical protein